MDTEDRGAFFAMPGRDASIRKNVIADVHAFVADEHGWSCNQLTDISLALTAEGTS